MKTNKLIKIYFLSRKNVTLFSSYLVGYDDVVEIHCDINGNANIDLIKITIKFPNESKIILLPKDKFLVEITTG